ncbi:MAG: DUF4926 domain-containing protein [Armatimonadota bacterium]|nr:DUF4926 domain-containing protein [Armatimonadota bacterium]
MDTKITILDVVALTQDLPEQSLFRGQVGTVVEILTPGVYEIEFNDDNGKTYATASIRENQLMLLHLRPVKAA